MFDPRLGRFFAVDPWTDQYAWQTPYAYHRNSPIAMIDWNGYGDDPDGGGFWDNIQTGLDVVGLIPAVGIIPDLINARISTARGDYAGASLSLAASIPIVGTAAGVAKLTKTVLVKVTKESVEATVKKVAKETVKKKTKKATNKKALNRGRANEAKTLADEGIPKNNKTFEVIDLKTKKPVKTIPDGIGESRILEVKDVKKLSNTKQIRAQREVAKQQNKTKQNKTKQNKTKHLKFIQVQKLT